MIISASRRTDIPAFFSDWFFNRIKEGFLLVRNPMNIHQISKINLSPDIVDCIVFWSKNPYRIIDKLEYFQNYYYYFQYTITGYGQRLEPNVPSIADSMKIFSILSKLIGRERIVWRYDPIIFTDEFNYKFHLLNFENIAQQLNNKTNRCVISFVDFYNKTKKNMELINYYELNDEQIKELANDLFKISTKYNLELTSCAEKIDLSDNGIKHGKCIDDKLIEEISGYILNVKKDNTQREECGCVASIDIGAYNTCPHGCLYCYANYNHNIMKINYGKHNPNSALLFGEVNSNDIIKERKILSCREAQKTLFDK